MPVINKTPHAIHIVGEKGFIDFSLPMCPREEAIRISVATVVEARIDGFPITRTIFGEPVGLPKYKKGTYYVVSAIVKGALPKRKDLLVPAGIVRDTKGIKIGCRSLDIGSIKI